ncbi:MAG: hypothetical protein ACUVQ4_08470 [bacterium]
MNKILLENCGGYTAGAPLDSDMNLSLSSTGGETRKIYNFSYYHPNGDAGVISLSEETLVYVSHGWNIIGDWVLTFWPNPPPCYIF